MNKCRFFLISFLVLTFLNAVFFAQETRPSRSYELRIFETQFVINKYQSEIPATHPLKFVVLHHNEQTGLKVTKEIIRERGGELFELVSVKNEAPTRNLFFEYRENEYSIDPNRMFTQLGISKDLRKRSCTEIQLAEELQTDEKKTKTYCGWIRPLIEELPLVIPEILGFAERLLELIKAEKTGAIVSVHNNSNQGYSLSSYIHGGAEWKSSERGLFFGKEDVDNFFLVTNESLFKRLVGSDNWDFNLVMQKQPPYPDDGSLSIYSGIHGLDYILVEAESYNGAARQRQMINRLIDTFLAPK